MASSISEQHRPPPVPSQPQATAAAAGEAAAAAVTTTADGGSGGTGSGSNLAALATAAIADAVATSVSSAPSPSPSPLPAGGTSAPMPIDPLPPSNPPSTPNQERPLPKPRPRAMVAAPILPFSTATGSGSTPTYAQPSPSTTPHQTPAQAVNGPLSRSHTSAIAPLPGATHASSAVTGAGSYPVPPQPYTVPSSSSRGAMHPSLSRSPVPTHSHSRSPSASRTTFGNNSATMTTPSQLRPHALPSIGAGRTPSPVHSLPPPPPPPPPPFAGAGVKRTPAGVVKNGMAPSAAMPTLPVLKAPPYSQMPIPGVRPYSQQHSAGGSRGFLAGGNASGGQAQKSRRKTNKKQPTNMRFVNSQAPQANQQSSRAATSNTNPNYITIPMRQVSDNGGGRTILLGHGKASAAGGASTSASSSTMMPPPPPPPPPKGSPPPPATLHYPGQRQQQQRSNHTHPSHKPHGHGSGLSPHSSSVTSQSSASASPSSVPQPKPRYPIHYPLQQATATMSATSPSPMSAAAAASSASVGVGTGFRQSQQQRQPPPPPRQHYGPSASSSTSGGDVSAMSSTQTQAATSFQSATSQAHSAASTAHTPYTKSHQQIRQPQVHGDSLPQQQQQQQTTYAEKVERAQHAAAGGGDPSATKACPPSKRTPMPYTHTIEALPQSRLALLHQTPHHQLSDKQQLMRDEQKRFQHEQMLIFQHEQQRRLMPERVDDKGSSASSQKEGYSSSRSAAPQGGAGSGGGSAATASTEVPVSGMPLDISQSSGVAPSARGKSRSSSNADEKVDSSEDPSASQELTPEQKEEQKQKMLQDTISQHYQVGNSDDLDSHFVESREDEPMGGLATGSTGFRRLGDEDGGVGGEGVYKRRLRSRRSTKRRSYAAMAGEEDDEDEDTATGGDESGGSARKRRRTRSVSNASQTSSHSRRSGVSRSPMLQPQAVPSHQVHAAPQYLPQMFPQQHPQGLGMPSAPPPPPAGGSGMHMQGQRYPDSPAYPTHTYHGTLTPGSSNRGTKKKRPPRKRQNSGGGSGGKKTAGGRAHKRTRSGSGSTSSLAAGSGSAATPMYTPGALMSADPNMRAMYSSMPPGPGGPGSGSGVPTVPHMPQLNMLAPGFPPSLGLNAPAASSGGPTSASAPGAVDPDQQQMLMQQQEYAAFWRQQSQGENQQASTAPSTSTPSTRPSTGTGYPRPSSSNANRSSRPSSKVSADTSLTHNASTVSSDTGAQLPPTAHKRRKPPTSSHKTHKTTASTTPRSTHKRARSELRPQQQQQQQQQQTSASLSSSSSSAATNVSRKSHLVTRISGGRSCRVKRRRVRTKSSAKSAVAASATGRSSSSWSKFLRSRRKRPQPVRPADSTDIDEKGTTDTAFAKRLKPPEGSDDAHMSSAHVPRTTSTVPLERELWSSISSKSDSEHFLNFMAGADTPAPRKRIVTPYYTLPREAALNCRLVLHSIKTKLAHSLTTLAARVLVSPVDLRDPAFAESAYRPSAAARRNSPSDHEPDPLALGVTPQQCERELHRVFFEALDDFRRSFQLMFPAANADSVPSVGELLAVATPSSSSPSSSSSLASSLWQPSMSLASMVSACKAYFMEFLEALQAHSRELDTPMPDIELSDSEDEGVVDGGSAKAASASAAAGVKTDAATANVASASASASVGVKSEGAAGAASSSEQRSNESLASGEKGSPPAIPRAAAKPEHSKTSNSPSKDSRPNKNSEIRTLDADKKSDGLSEPRASDECLEVKDDESTTSEGMSLTNGRSTADAEMGTTGACTSACEPSGDAHHQTNSHADKPNGSLPSEEKRAVANGDTSSKDADEKNPPPKDSDSNTSNEKKLAVLCNGVSKGVDAAALKLVKEESKWSDVDVVPRIKSEAEKLASLLSQPKPSETAAASRLPNGVVEGVSSNAKVIPPAVSLPGVPIKTSPSKGDGTKTSKKQNELGSHVGDSNGSSTRRDETPADSADTEVTPKSEALASKYSAPGDKREAHKSERKSKEAKADETSASDAKSTSKSKNGDVSAAEPKASPKSTPRRGRSKDRKNAPKSSPSTRRSSPNAAAPFSSPKSSSSSRGGAKSKNRSSSNTSSSSSSASSASRSSTPKSRGGGRTGGGAAAATPKRSGRQAAAAAANTAFLRRSSRRLKLAAQAAEAAALKEQEEERAAAAMARRRSDAAASRGKANEFDAQAYLSGKGGFPNRPELTEEEKRARALEKARREKLAAKVARRDAKIRARQRTMRNRVERDSEFLMEVCELLVKVLYSCAKEMVMPHDRHAPERAVL